MNNSAELESRIKAKLAESGQPRVKGVDYKVKLYNETNEMIELKNFKIIEADLLFGTKA